MTDAQVIVVGTGPAGTSAALALVARGVRVLVLESGTNTARPPTAGNYLDLRFHDHDQWRWLLGEHGEAMREAGAASPKLRVPGLQGVFEGYARKNRVAVADDFRLVGALAPGGLSNAWGCGVAAFSRSELGDLALESDAMADSYARVARRVGISGASDDALREVVGLDEHAGPALPLDELHSRIWVRRNRISDGCGFTLGRARVAVLGTDREGRRACDFSGTCLWGCANRATWSAAYDLELLRRHPLATVRTGVHVTALATDGDSGWVLDTAGIEGTQQFRARRVMLAAGTIASTRLALGALAAPPERLSLQSNPMAAFLLWLPGALGTARTRSFGLAQLSFVATLPGGDAAFGNTFSTAGLPVSEFLAHLPISRRAGIPFLRALMSSTIVGNAFLPGRLSDHTVSLAPDGSLRIKGGESEEMGTVMRSLETTLTRGFRRLGAWMLPGSFLGGAKGADLHYASTMPIKQQPAAHECRMDGQIAGLPGVYSVDGASLPTLPAKAHTLTIMANADRIARGLRNI